MPMRQRNDDDTYTPEEITHAVRAADGPEGLLAAMAESKRRGRGRQKAPTKLLITLRLDRDAVARYRATGKGWQSRISEDVHKASLRRRRAPATRTKRQCVR